MTPLSDARLEELERLSHAITDVPSEKHDFVREQFNAALGERSNKEKHELFRVAPVDASDYAELAAACEFDAELLFLSHGARALLGQSVDVGAGFSLQYLMILYPNARSASEYSRKLSTLLTALDRDLPELVHWEARRMSDAEKRRIDTKLMDLQQPVRELMATSDAFAQIPEDAKMKIFMFVVLPPVEVPA